MSSISNDLSSITGNAPTPSEQTDEALLGTPAPLTQGETPEEAADATLVQLSGTATNSTNVSSELDSGVPADLAAAGALVSELAGQISGTGSQALSAQSLISADAAYKLTKN
ncbi:MAG TPA: hypothetical protein VG293_03765 [Solirubrobacteraceae bacterium]|jgi:hypothetical protein|nr:hypothetical protein [Solirubrobacteraceae bacterium]